MEGKHTLIEAPAVSGSDFYNYNGTFSVVLCATVDCNFHFRCANVDCQGLILDEGVFKNTSFYKLMVDGRLHLPPKTIIPGCDSESSYVLKRFEAT